MGIGAQIAQWQWLWPFVLWALPLPLLVLLLPASRRLQPGALRVPFWERLQHLSGDGGNAISWWRFVWLWTLWGLLLAALARPVESGQPVTLPREGRNLMVAVDISGSMRHRDMVWKGQYVDRLTAVKGVLKSFLHRREGDRVGLILFGSQAFVQAPLTFDVDTLQQFLDETVVGLAGDKTAIGDAIGLAIKQAADSGEGENVLVLLTDGENTAGSVSPSLAAQYAAREKLKIHTIAFGRDPYGRFHSPQSLTDIAELTGGKAFQAAQTDSLEKVYRAIEALEPVAADPEVFRPRIERYDVFVKLALAWIIVPLSLSALLQRHKNA